MLSAPLFCVYFLLVLSTQNRVITTCYGSQHFYVFYVARTMKYWFSLFYFLLEYLVAHVNSWLILNP